MDNRRARGPWPRRGLWRGGVSGWRRSGRCDRARQRGKSRGHSRWRKWTSTRRSRRHGGCGGRSGRGRASCFGAGWWSCGSNLRARRWGRCADLDPRGCSRCADVRPGRLGESSHLRVRRLVDRRACFRGCAGGRCRCGRVSGRHCPSAETDCPSKAYTEAEPEWLPWPPRKWRLVGIDRGRRFPWRCRGYPRRRRHGAPRGESLWEGGLSVGKPRPRGHPRDRRGDPITCNGPRFGGRLNDHRARGLLERHGLWRQPRPIRGVHRRADLASCIRPFQRADLACRKAIGCPRKRRSVIQLPRGSERGRKPFQFFRGQLTARAPIARSRVRGIARVSHDPSSLTPPSKSNNGASTSAPEKDARRCSGSGVRANRETASRRASRRASSRAKVATQRVVPVVGHLADRLEQVLEFFVVEARQPSQGSNDHLAPLRVDCESCIRRCQK